MPFGDFVTGQHNVGTELLEETLRTRLNAALRHRDQWREWAKGYEQRLGYQPAEGWPKPPDRLDWEEE